MAKIISTVQTIHLQVQTHILQANGGPFSHSSPGYVTEDRESVVWAGWRRATGEIIGTTVIEQTRIFKKNVFLEVNGKFYPEIVFVKLFRDHLLRSTL